MRHPKLNYCLSCLAEIAEKTGTVGTQLGAQLRVALNCCATPQARLASLRLPLQNPTLRCVVLPPQRCPFGRIGEACEIDFLAPCRQSPAGDGECWRVVKPAGSCLLLAHTPCPLAAPAWQDFTPCFWPTCPCMHPHAVSLRSTHPLRWPSPCQAPTSHPRLQPTAVSCPQSHANAGDAAASTFV